MDDSTAISLVVRAYVTAEGQGEYFEDMKRICNTEVSWKICRKYFGLELDLPECKTLQFVLGGDLVILVVHKFPHENR